MIRRESPISRNEIAERLDVSLPTVMRIVDELIKEDLIRPRSSTQWTGGRRRSLLEFNAEGQVVIGIDLGGVKFYGAIADLGGNILEEADVEREEKTGEESYSQLVGLINRLLASASIKERRLRGIGVGVPGITHHKEGIVTWSFALNWQDYPLKQKLTNAFQMPITVDNDVNLAAVGELWFGAGQNTQNMVLVTVGTGIGAGVIIDGTLYRGSREASGEVGHMIVGREFLGKRFADFGALETMASGTGIAARGRQAFDGPRPASPLAGPSAQEVFDAARQGQAWAAQVIDETFDYLAIAIGNLSVAFDPEVIVLGGGLSRWADPLVEPILRRLEGMIPTLPRLVVSPLGRRAVTMGAITNILFNTDNFYLVRKLS
ncbi:MAG: ROK family transcriptional regulator [Anaerolineae bacterium]